jgi:hypothetical protein
MENRKYSNICKDYEKIIKEECSGEKITDPYCDVVSTLLENCYKFKAMKIKRQQKSLYTHEDFKLHKTH